MNFFIFVMNLSFCMFFFDFYIHFNEDKTILSIAFKLNMSL